MEMPQQLLHLIKARTFIDKDAGIGVTKIMDPHIRQPGMLSDSFPRRKEAIVGLSEAGILKDVIVLLCPDVEHFISRTNFMQQINRSAA